MRVLAFCRTRVDVSWVVEVIFLGKDFEGMKRRSLWTFVHVTLYMTRYGPLSYQYYRSRHGKHKT